MDDKIKQLAIKAGAQYFQHADYWMTTDLNIHQFAKLVAATEREQCAKLCEKAAYWDGNSCAEAIRARGDKHD